VYRFQDYVPSQVKDFVREKVAYVRSILADQGFLPKSTSGDGPAISRALQRARDAHSKAVAETNRLRSDVDQVNKKISADYGPQDVFLAIKGECISLNSGEYTYEVCIMEKVTQKSNKDNTNTNLGYVWSLLPLMKFVRPL
jgi:protein kinase C substrate 80K-H